MVVRDLIGNTTNVLPTTVIKLLLGRPTLNIFLDKFAEMKNNGSVENIDIINNLYDDAKYIPKTKKENALKKIVDANSFLEISNWDTGYDFVQGPFLSDREIIFYNDKSNLLLVFTYYPLHNVVKNKNVISDVLVRELKSYVYDNVPSELAKNIKSNVTKTINFNDLMDNKTLTSRFTSDDRDIIRIINIFDNYFWEIIRKEKTYKKENNA